MTLKELRAELQGRIAQSIHPPELAVDVMIALQEHYGFMSDEAMAEAADLLDMSPLQLEELATFYTFIYREPVGKFVIHLCDSLICWMDGYITIRDYLCRKLDIGMGQTTADGLFTLLPVCCIGYCDRSPAMLINKRVYGHLTAEKIDEILGNLKSEG